MPFSALSAVMSGGGALLGGLQSALSTVLKTASGLIAGALGLVTGALGVVTGALGAAGAALSVFVRGVMTMTAEVVKTAQQIASIRNDTGKSMGDSAQGYQNARAAGMSGEEATSFFSQAGPMADKRAAAWHLPKTTDANFFSELARKSQGMGFEQKTAMLTNISNAPPSAALKKVANTRPELIEREQKYQGRVQGALGVTPKALEQLSTELPLLTNRASMFFEAVKTRFITGLLPLLTEGLERATAFLEANAGRIASAIQMGVSWLYADLPQLLLDAGSVGLNALEMVTDGIFGFAETLAGMVRAIGEGQSGLFNVFKMLGGALDWLTGTFQNFMIGLAAFKAMMSGKTPAQARQDAQDAFIATPATHFREGLEKFEKSGQTKKWADNIDSFVADGRQKRDGILGAGRGALASAQKSLGTPQERQAEIVSLLKELNVSNKDIAKATGKTASDKAQGGDVLGALKNQLGRDSFLTATR